MDAQQRRELRILPKALQDIANKAIQDSTGTDLQALYENIVDSGPNISTSWLSALLPVFILHLDSALIPRLDKARYTADELGAIQCARWALKAVGRIFPLIQPEDEDEDASEDDTVWERMLLWMSFLQTKFLHPDPDRDKRLGISFPDGEIARSVVQGFSVTMSYLSDLNLLKLRSTSSTQHLVAALWLFVVHQHIDYSDLPRRQGPRAALQLQSAIMLIVLPTVCPDTPEGAAVLLYHAGTINRVLATAMRYVRFIVDTVRVIRDPTPDNIEIVDLAVDALAYGVGFIERCRRGDPAHSEALVALGSVQLVTTATRHIARLLLADAHPPGRGRVRARNTPVERLEKLTSVYHYLHYAVLYLGDDVTTTCHALNAGILEAIFRTWLYTLSCSPAHTQPKLTENAAIIMLWRVIPRYFVYPRVLRAFARALSRPAFCEAEQLARHDDHFWGLWAALRGTALDYIECMEELDGSVRGLYVRRCVSHECPDRDRDGGSQNEAESESDSEAEAGAYLRCTGCLVCTYCSKACQREEWKGGHWVGCKILRDGLGTLSSSIVRRSLRLIGEIEKMEYIRYGLRIQQLFEEACRAHGRNLTHLALEMDLVNQPLNISIVPLDVERYLRLAVSSGWSLELAREEWEDALDMIRGHQLGGMPDLLTVVKFWDGQDHELRTILSPAATLEAFCDGFEAI
ncbi:hypothetical protein BJ138DRAFT_1156533 [Hygrophoropsis aurantiaca]|uniref:Uncharacterized protein n=1 Tax=Hygrophoropsis aurantiaca TaxID=72124 RepID=A0ACB8A6Q7_9AGAM|nr:hypothetical protein BJ138DRAFT_1156533 [Hygrophoropsis aurantiaca]